MKIQRFLGIMLAAALLTGCSQEKKNAAPLVAGRGSTASPANVAKPMVNMTGAEETKAAKSEGKKAVTAKDHARELIAAQRPFDFNFSLPDVDGKTVALKDFSGNILIVDMWGTWCPPCKKEIPHFIDLLKKYEGKGLRIVGINYENANPKDAPNLIREFAKNHKIPYPCLIGDQKTGNQIPNFDSLPTTLFIDRTGKVRLCLVGLHEAPELEAVIEELLDEKMASLK